MKYLIILFCLININLNSVQRIELDSSKDHRISKFIIENHTYIHIKNIWNGADSHMWHDLDCEYCKKNMKDALDKLNQGTPSKHA